MLLDVKGDLDEYMDDVESIIQLPEEFDEVVDIAVDYQKDKAEFMAITNGEEESKG